MWPPPFLWLPITGAFYYVGGAISKWGASGIAPASWVIGLLMDLVIVTCWIRLAGAFFTRQTPLI
jgi:hypothetical protein